MKSESSPKHLREVTAEPVQEGVVPTTSLWESLSRLWKHLPKRRQRHMKLLIVPMLLAAMSETVSLGIMLPFLAVLAAPDQVFQLPLAAWLAGLIGVTEPRGLLPVLTLAFVLVVIGAAALRIGVMWANSRLAYAIGEDMGTEVFRRTLHQPYQVHAQRNSANVMSALVKIKATSLTLAASLTMLSSFWISFFIITSLMLINWQVAVVSFGVLGGIYVVIMFTARLRLAQNSRTAAQSLTSSMKTVQEGLGGIRDVILDGNQDHFQRAFNRSTHTQARAQADSYFVSYAPRYVVESLGMMLFIIVAYFFADRFGGFAAMLPLLGTFALGAQRLMPVMQQVYLGWATLKSNQAVLLDILGFLDQPVGKEFEAATPEPLQIARSIAFDKVGFRYHEDSPLVVRELDFSIARGQRVGFLGSTGSGKSTTFDLLMGLLPPSEGAILIDGVPLTADNRRAWQRAIAHVPQSIYLSDATMAENIAFGMPSKAIDMDRVRDAARKAHIADHIEGLPDGYDTQVGERGIRLSGGQRQRIGIARALYKQAQVLVFDEATSALDNATEKAVMEAIEGLGRDLTIFMIAHRLSTLSGCDLVIELERGAVHAIGSYDELVARRTRQAS